MISNKRYQHQKLVEYLSELLPNIARLETEYRQIRQVLQNAQQQMVEFRFTLLKLSMRVDSFCRCLIAKQPYTGILDIVANVRRSLELLDSSTGGFTFFKQWLFPPNEHHNRFLGWLPMMLGTVTEAEKEAINDLVRWALERV